MCGEGCGGGGVLCFVRGRDRELHTHREVRDGQGEVVIHMHRQPDKQTLLSFPADLRECD